MHVLSKETVATLRITSSYIFTSSSVITDGNNAESEAAHYICVVRASMQAGLNLRTRSRETVAIFCITSSPTSMRWV